MGLKFSNDMVYLGNNTRKNWKNRTITVPYVIGRFQREVGDLQ